MYIYTLLIWYSWIMFNYFVLYDPKLEFYLNKLLQTIHVEIYFGGSLFMDSTAQQTTPSSGYI